MLLRFLIFAYFFTFCMQTMRVQGVKCGEFTVSFKLIHWQWFVLGFEGKEMIIYLDSMLLQVHITLLPCTESEKQIIFV